ncbi:hypothetical protein AB1Y20_013225 [Prymnesium parvum]|uniref:FAD-binding PCMH-type domain-containing protein n=1 Tax=Prymnesium parvum TaxID=97485 RepID=A0AB34IMT8_PRYPA
MAEGQPCLRLGLLGCSWFALRAHIPALLALEAPARRRAWRVRLVAVCSRTRKSMAKAEAAAGRPIARHARMEEMLADPRLDVVLVVLPIPLVGAAVERALLAGKHVISEKPAAASLGAALSLYERMCAREQPTPVWTVVENWAHKPSLVWIRQRLQERAIGAVLGAHCAHHEAIGAKWSEGWRGAAEHEGGWLLDVGVHWARLLRALLGPALACSASATRFAAHLPPCDTLQGWVKFKHAAAPATISLSFSTPAASAPTSGGFVPAGLPSLTLYGERGSICWWARQECGARVRLHRAREGSDEVALADDWVTGGVHGALEDALGHIVREAWRCSSAGGAPPLSDGRLAWPCRVPCEEAILDIALVAALLRSSECGSVIEPAALLGAHRLLCGAARPLADSSASRASRPAVRVRCSSEEDVVAALKLASERGLKVHACGACHSWSWAIDASGACVLEMAPMDRVLRLDAAAARVECEPGLTLHELRRVLEAHQLTIGSWPMLQAQTVGGAVACGSHGSSGADGSLSDAVVGLRLIRADGVAVDLSDDDDGEPPPLGAEARVPTSPARHLLLQAARQSAGMLGVVTALTLQAQRSYHVRRHVSSLRVGEFVARCDAMLRAFRHVWVLWRLGQDSLCVCALEDVGQLPLPGATPYDGSNWWAGPPSFQAPRADGGAGDVSASAAAGPAAGGCASEDGSRADGHEDTRTAGHEGPRWLSTQYAFPMAMLRRVVDAMEALPARLQGLVHGREIELKFLSSSQRTLLGPNAQRGSVVCVNIHWRMHPDEDEALHLFEGLLQSLGGTPHLGKRHRLEKGQAAQLIPGLAEFSVVARKIDPNRMFEPTLALSEELSIQLTESLDSPVGLHVT